MRIGIGYDIHRVIHDKQEIVLGGVVIPAPFGLEAWSDGDVLVHAMCDALLGAAGLRDIGYYFPPGYARFKNIDSLTLLGKVIHLIDEKNYTIVNIDSVVIAEEPKLFPHVPAMQERLAAACSIDVDRIMIKATTNEKVGPEGRGEAISARAVVLIK